MNIDPTYISMTLSTISKVTATILSLYLIIFIFTLNYFWRDFKKRRITTKQKKKIVFFGAWVINIIIAIIYFFILPSVEFKSLTYLLIGLIIFYLCLSLSLFEKKGKLVYMEQGVVIYSIIFALLSFILGFYIIISSITSIPNSIYIEMSYFFKLLSYTRLYFVLTLISLIYLISFVLIHKILVTKN